MIQISRKSVRESAEKAFAKAVEFHGAEYAVTNVRDDRSDKAKRLGDIIRKSSFGCQRENVAALMSVILGEPVEVPNRDIRVFDGKKLEFPGEDIKENTGFEHDKVPLLSGTYVVPLSNENDHNYTIGEAVMVLHDDKCVCYDGREGLYITSDLRLATVEEIEAFMLKGIEEDLTLELVD